MLRKSTLKPLNFYKLALRSFVNFDPDCYYDCYNRDAIHSEKPKIDITSGVNFINILRATFSLIFWCHKIAKPTVIRENLLNLLSYVKLVHKMLMKLTTGYPSSEKTLTDCR